MTTRLVPATANSPAYYYTPARWVLAEPDPVALEAAGRALGYPLPQDSGIWTPAQWDAYRRAAFPMAFAAGAPSSPARTGYSPWRPVSPSRRAPVYNYGAPAPAWNRPATPVAPAPAAWSGTAAPVGPAWNRSGTSGYNVGPTPTTAWNTTSTPSYNYGAF